jgi:FtsP/CotA-like multicopper oxidase with cupredoxin domain
VPPLLLLAALAGAFPVGATAVRHHHSQPTIRPAVVGDTLSPPSLLANESREPHTVEVTLTAAVTRLELRPGVETKVFAYNGQVPGPTLEVWEGDRVIVHFRNELPEPTTIHWHGIHLPFHADGSPFDPVKPGGQLDYVFTVKRGTAGTYWYHPHPDQRAGPEVAKGLFGAIIVRAADDPLRGLVTEKLLILHDNRFRPDGSVDLSDPDSPAGRRDFENGREGNVLFVNGQIMPTISIRPGEVQRWRVINASAARVYKLAIPGHTFLHVGSDGGLFQKPVETGEIVVANTERVELLVRGTGRPGERDTLEDLPYNRYIPQTRPADWDSTRNLLTLQYTDDPPAAPVTLPATLRAVSWLDTTAVTARRVFALSQGLINGKTMDLHRVDVTVPLGATEIWEIENLVGMDHPFHLHGFRFQVLDRDGVPEPFPYWKDTVNVPKHETVRLIVKFEDYPGLWMFHCHILDHEDAGMMGILEVK